ncbi:unnamed protein product [marine sediment metagenome]|uniref:Uncharacterized protein n=1 Tax=marine sediment metagenome TaxID=412755 RepID=X1G2X3_9ZZZZ
MKFNKLILIILILSTLIIQFPLLLIAGDFQTAEKHFYEGKYEEALSHYQKSVSKYKNNKKISAYIDYQIAECYYFQRKYNKAIKKYNDIIERDSQNEIKIRIMSRLGDSYFLIKN